MLTAAVDISIHPHHRPGRPRRHRRAALRHDRATACRQCTTAASWRPSPTTPPVTSCRARKAATEDYEPGIPGIHVNIGRRCRAAGPADHLRLHPAPTRPTPTDRSHGDLRSATTRRDGDVAPATSSDSSATYSTETWHRPDSCIPRDANGNPNVQDAIKTYGATLTDQDCVESTMHGTTFGFADGDAGAADGQQVDGNYGFVTYHPGDYIVSVDIPEDPIFGRPLYKVRTEDPDQRLHRRRLRAARRRPVRHGVQGLPQGQSRRPSVPQLHGATTVFGSRRPHRRRTRTRSVSVRWSRSTRTIRSASRYLQPRPPQRRRQPLRGPAGAFVPIQVDPCRGRPVRGSRTSTSGPTCRSRRSSTATSPTTSRCRPTVARRRSAKCTASPTCRSASTTGRTVC